MAPIDDLPLFPLSNVVLLPQVSVPLFIFEPRYRQMTRDVLAGGHRIGMIAVRPEGIAEMGGDPDLFDVGCVGRIAHAEPRPDGTFQILLIGEHRFRVREEHPRTGDRLYRSACVDLLDDREPDGEADRKELERTRARVMDALARLVDRSRSGPSSEDPLAGFAQLEPERLVNALVQSISLEPIERQQLLEADSIVSRFQILDDLLRFRLASVGTTGMPPGSLPN